MVTPYRFGVLGECKNNVLDGVYVIYYVNIFYVARH